MLLMTVVSLNVRIYGFQYFTNSKELDSWCFIVERTQNKFLFSHSQRIRNKEIGILKNIGCTPNPYQASPFPGASRFSRIKHIFSHWGHTRQFSAVYVSAALDQLTYAAWFGGSASERSQRSSLVETAGLPMGSPSSSASSSLSLIQPWGPWLQSNGWASVSLAAGWAS